MSSRSIFRAVFFIVITYISGYMLYGIYRVNKSQKESGGVTQSVFKEYLDIFSDSQQVRFKSPYTYTSYVRNPFSTFTYRDDFEVVVYKFSANSKALPQVHFNYKKSGGRGSDVYSTVFGSLLNLYYKEGKPSFSGNLFVSFDEGAVEKIAENDTIKQYFLSSPSASIGYTASDINDILISGRYGRMPVPMVFALLLRNDGLFMILIAPRAAADNIDRNVVNRLLYSTP